jgi:hypothetical protein
MAGKFWTQVEIEKLWENQHSPGLATMFPGRTYDAIQKQLTRLKRSGLFIDKNPPQEKETESLKVAAAEYINRTYGESGLSIQGVTSKPIKSLADLFSWAEIDPLEWEVTKHEVGAWTVPTKDKEGNAHIHQMNKVSASLKPLKSLSGVREAIEELCAGIIPSKAVAKLPKSSGKYTGVFSIPDIHLGKLAHGEETRHGNYDTRIAEGLFMTALQTLVDRAAPMGLSDVVFVVGNDMLNTDNTEGTTTGGTRQDVDTRIHRTYQTAQRMLVASIDYLLGVTQKVRVVVCPGNHDALLTWTVGELLRAYYRDSDRVEILNEPSKRQYVKVGSTLLMFTHGDKVKVSELDRIMTREVPDLYASCLHHEVHLGHFHQEKVTDKMGIITRVLPSLCAPDAWHSAMGYLSKRSAQSFIYHHENGLEQIGYWYPA